MSRMISMSLRDFSTPRAAFLLAVSVFDFGKTYNKNILNKFEL